MTFIKAAQIVILLCWSQCPQIFGAQILELEDKPLLSNLDEIVENVNNAKSSWTAGQNFPSGVSGKHLESLVSKFDPLSDLDEEVRLCKCEVAGTQPGHGPDEPEFDPRKKWPNCPSITHIPNQGACQGSWAVTAAGVISDRQCVASDGKETSLMSAQQLLSCCSDCGYGCGGGWPGKAFRYYQKHGVATGGDYNSQMGCQPFSIKPVDMFDNNAAFEGDETPECVKECTNKQYPKKFKRDLHFGKKVFVPCCCTVWDSLKNEGSIASSMVVYEDFFAYKSGIYRHIQGKKVGYQSVRLLGWGEENGVPYWIAANSWGKNWGENGFFRILRGQGECQIEFGYVAPIPKTKKRVDVL